MDISLLRLSGCRSWSLEGWSIRGWPGGSEKMRSRLSPVIKLGSSMLSRKVQIPSPTRRMRCNGSNGTVGVCGGGAADLRD